MWLIWSRSKLYYRTEWLRSIPSLLKGTLLLKKSGIEVFNRRGRKLWWLRTLELDKGLKRVRKLVRGICHRNLWIVVVLGGRNGGWWRVTFEKVAAGGWWGVLWVVILSASHRTGVRWPSILCWTGGVWLRGGVWRKNPNFSAVFYREFMFAVGSTVADDLFKLFNFCWYESFVYRLFC